MRTLMALVLVAWSWLGIAGFVVAQPAGADRGVPNAGGRLVDGLLRTLVDSQMNMDGRTAAPGSTPLGPNNSVSPELRRAIESFTKEASELIAGLQYETRYDRNVGSLLGDAVRVRATLDVLARRLQTGADLTRLADDYATLDNQWRSLAHQIRRWPSVSSNLLRRVDALDTLNQTLSKQFRVGPQVGRDDLTQAFAALANDLGHLSEDIDQDLHAEAKRDPWMRAARDLETRAEQLRMAVASDYAYRDLSQYYRQFYDAWMSLKRELRPIENRYLQRTLNRITKTNDRLHQLLWLPPVIDGQDILYLAEALHRSVENVGDQITLKDLVQSNGGSDLLKRAREFYVQSEEFRRAVAREKNLENIKWAFNRLDTAWYDLKAILTPVDDPKAIQRIALLDGALSELRNGLGLQPAFDRDQTIGLASSLNNMADLLAYDLQRTVGRSNQYPPQFRDDAIRTADNLRRAAREINESISRSSEAGRVREQVRMLNQEWLRLQSMLGQLTPADRQELTRSYGEIAPAMVKLQFLYAAN